MVSINPFDVLLWTLRRNEQDVIKLYTALSPVMQLATGGNMLNFGYWDSDHSDPLSAQENLCSIFAEFGELESAKRIIDVGSGLSAPAILWRDRFEKLSIYCININFSQLLFSAGQKKIELINSSSTKLPFSENSVDRVLALESAQHFKPFSEFISEAKRILSANGLLVIAIPITLKKSSFSNLGILKFTWSSEHYSLDEIRKMISMGGFKILSEKLIGSNVYEPLGDYYIKNRITIKNSILKKYPKYVENILYHSITKMKKSSQDGIVDYAMIKCRL